MPSMPPWMPQGAELAALAKEQSTAHSIITRRAFSNQDRMRFERVYGTTAFTLEEWRGAICLLQRHDLVLLSS